MQTATPRRHDEAVARHLDFFYAEVAPPTALRTGRQVEAEFLIRRVLERDPRLTVEIGTAGSAGAPAHGPGSARRRGAGGGHRGPRILLFRSLQEAGLSRGADVRPDARPLRPALRQDQSGPGSHPGAEGGRLLFIDGNHSHPWATMDTILALPFISEETTIVYHDINLHNLASPQLGPHYLFYALPARDKIVVGDWPWPNIGALRLGRPPAELIDEDHADPVRLSLDARVLAYPGLAPGHAVRPVSGTAALGQGPAADLPEKRRPPVTGLRRVGNRRLRR